MAVIVKCFINLKYVFGNQILHSKTHKALQASDRKDPIKFLISTKDSEKESCEIPLFFVKAGIHKRKYT